MQKAIAVLMGEHRLIEQALGSLETYSAALRAGTPMERVVVGEYAAFLRGFADGCHHGKEEDILFRCMVEHGFPRDAGPLAVMYHEHELGRAHVHAMIDIGARPVEPAEADAQQFVKTAESYVSLLRQHIVKEDHVLYPMALKMLSGPELDAINTQFEQFERRMCADGEYERLQSLADRLTSRFRPDPERMAAAAPMMCCAH